MQPQNSSRQSGRLWGKLFASIVGAALGMLVIFLVLDLSFTSLAAQDLIDALRKDGLRDALGSLAEVMAAVLGLSLTVVAIVVQLASQRYSPKIVDLFMRDPINLSAFGFMVVSCIYCVLLPAFAGPNAVPDIALSAGLVLAITNFGLLLPYFGHVFAFLQPDSIITQIEVNAQRSLLKALHRPGDTSVEQQHVANAIERIADNCVAALGQSDRRLALHSVRTLEEMIAHYLRLKEDLPPSWAKVPAEFFFTLSEEFYREIVMQKSWVEAKSLMEFEHVFRRALGEMNELVSQLSSSTRVIGEAALQANDEEALWLAVRFFNTYIRHALNARNVRAVYNVLYQYRRLCTSVMEIHPLICQRVVKHLVYYGQTANAMGLPFVTVTTAHDVRVLCERAFSSPNVDVMPILELFLSLDQNSEAKIEELALIGVRKAQSILGAFFIARGAESLAQRIREDMCDESPTRLEHIRDAILAVTSRKFWEVTDRGFNFDYVEDDMRPYITMFFEPLLRKRPGETPLQEGAHASHERVLVPEGPELSGNTPVVDDSHASQITE